MELKLGKLDVRYDARTFKLADLLAPDLPPAPPEFDNDTGLPYAMPYWMLKNDEYGDCVMAMRGHHTLRFEGDEQGHLKRFNEKKLTNAVVKEYFKESHGYDSGLVILDSLNAWRKKGWKVGCPKYCIYAFAAVHKQDYEEIKQSIYLLNGIDIGIQVPQSAMDQFYAGEPWTVVPGSPIKGGHGTYVVAYNAIGPVCVTWGKRQQMTWPFLSVYCDEAYAVVDNIDRFLKGPPRIDVKVLNGYLRSVSN